MSFKIEYTQVIRANRPSTRLVYIPDEEIAQQMRSKIKAAINDNQYNADYLKIVKKNILGSYDHFAYVRVGAYLFYISERGVDILCDCMYRNFNPSRTQTIIRNYNIRATTDRKLYMQKFICLKYKIKDDDRDKIIPIMSKSEKELADMISKDLGYVF